MRRFFVDTFYWVALFNPKDGWHERVLGFSQTAGPCHFTQEGFQILFLDN